MWTLSRVNQFWPADS
uniref:Uncharacterized protein n=1 Tax=Anguilla anguilla TaxID=7936 RepID=A0A0E9VGM5_ANGAN